MNVQLPEDLSSIQKVGVVDDPGVRLVRVHDDEKGLVLLLGVPGEEREVEDQRDPVTIDQEQEGQETMHSSLGNDVGVESVAEVNGVDVVARDRKLAPGLIVRWQACAQMLPTQSLMLEYGPSNVMTYHSKSLYIMVKKT